uniref:MFS domain-containing protein n=1 Tax=Gongylonema pulchrum TaxID=637853 RepID=A0A183DG90_9BILA
LITHGRQAEAQQVLRKLYGDDKKWIDYEMGEVKREMQREVIMRQERGNEFVLWRVLRTKHVRKALMLGCALQMFQQLAAINAILYVSFAHGLDLTSPVQVVGTIPPLKLIERLGRRTLVLTSLVGVIITLCMMGGAFIIVNRDSAKIDPGEFRINKCFLGY